MTAAAGPDAGAISRRAAIALLGGAGLGALVGCRAGGPSPTALVCDAFDATGGIPAGLFAIGSRYVELYPDDDPAVVAADLATDDPATLTALAAQVRADFDAGDVVDVDGWVLARTEARAAAVLVGC